MTDRKLLFVQLYLVALVAILHLVGTALSLYWLFWWYDILVHFLASIWVAFGAIWIARQVGIIKTGICAVLAVCMIGVSWEIFEYLIGAVNTKYIVFDTALDMFMNFFGGWVGIVLAQRGQ